MEDERKGANNDFTSFFVIVKEIWENSVILNLVQAIVDTPPPQLCCDLSPLQELRKENLELREKVK